MRNETPLGRGDLGSAVRIPVSYTHLEKHPNAQSLGIIPISSQMERLHFVKKDGETQFALVEELVLHLSLIHIWACLVRRTNTRISTLTTAPRW